MDKHEANRVLQESHRTLWSGAQKRRWERMTEDDKRVRFDRWREALEDVLPSEIPAVFDELRKKRWAFSDWDSVGEEIRSAVCVCRKLSSVREQKREEQITHTHRVAEWLARRADPPGCDWSAKELFREYVALMSDRVEQPEAFRRAREKFGINSDGELNER